MFVSFEKTENCKGLSINMDNVVRFERKGEHILFRKQGDNYTLCITFETAKEAEEAHYNLIHVLGNHNKWRAV